MESTHIRSIPADSAEVKRSCTLLCLDVPQGTEFGIDYYEFQAGNNFKGIKLIPAGIHFIYYSGSSKYGGEGPPRTGMFLHLESAAVKVLKWNPDIEDFYDINQMDNDEIDRYIAGVQRYDFDQYLGPYPSESLQKWWALSCYITPQLLSTIEPTSKKIASEYDTGTISSKEHLSKAEKDLQTQSEQFHQQFKTPQQPVENEKEKHYYRPFYSHIPSLSESKKSSSSAVGMDRTQLHFDKTHIFQKLTKRYSDPLLVLGELQFAFICFLMGQSFDGFDQWKSMLSVLCACDSGIKTRPEFFYKFVAVLHFQLKQVPEDFFVDVISSNNFLHQLLKGFLELLDDDTLNSQLYERGQKFRRYLVKRFGETFSKNAEFDDDEYAPVIVEL